MEKLNIVGGDLLNGIVYISGVKNSVVVLIFVIILVNFEVIIEGFLEILDIEMLCDLLKEIGGNVYFENGEMVVDFMLMISMLFFNGKVKKFCVLYYLMGVMFGCFK